MQDEPGARQFAALGALKEEMVSAGYDRAFYVNLLPMYASPAQLRFGAGAAPFPAAPMDYRDYLNGYCEKVRPEFLSLDYYPFQEEDKFLADYFLQLELVREAAARRRIPFWVFIQIAAWGETVPRVTPGQVAWQVNTALACGAQGIQYFTYWTPDPPPGPERFEKDSGLISLDGVRQPLFETVARLNRHLAACGPVLLEGAFAGIVVCGETPAPVRADVYRSFGPLKKISGGDALCGCFEGQGCNFYYLANNSWQRQADMELSFRPDTRLFAVRGGVRQKIAAARLSVRLEPGEGMMIGVEKR